MRERIPEFAGENVPFRALTLRERNAFQIALMKRSGNPMGWQEENSKRFHELVESRSEVRRLFVENPDEAIREAERILSGSDN